MATHASPFTYAAVTLHGQHLYRVLADGREIGLMQRTRGGWAACEWHQAHGTTQQREVFATQAEVGWYWLKRKGARG